MNGTREESAHHRIQWTERLIAEVLYEIGRRQRLGQDGPTDAEILLMSRGGLHATVSRFGGRALARGVTA